MLFGLYDSLVDFLSSGGDVLKVIFIATFFLWTLILERFTFFKYKYPQMMKECIDQWDKRNDKQSWSAHRIREYKISQISQSVNQFIPLIDTMVKLAPLLGLLGTVTGMISVFDVMAVAGTGNARLMASGISLATIPTMAGMVTALSGLYFSTYFGSKAKKSIKLLEDQMIIHV